MKCDPIQAPEHGSRIGNIFTFNSELRFSCSEGYRLEGSSKVKCLASGRWLGRIPVCRRKFALSLQLLLNSLYYYIFHSQNVL